MRGGPTQDFLFLVSVSDFPVLCFGIMRVWVSLLPYFLLFVLLYYTYVGNSFLYVSV